MQIASNFGKLGLWGGFENIRNPLIHHLVLNFF
jgi:hypothetical protein